MDRSAAHRFPGRPMSSSLRPLLLALVFAGLPSAHLGAQAHPGCQSYQVSAFDAGNAPAFNSFGSGVDLWDDWLFVGDPDGTPPGGISNGSVYVFEQDGLNWFLHAKFDYAGPGVSAALGACLAADEGILVAGAQGDDDPLGGSGSAFVYELVGSSWTFTQKLVPSTQSAFQEFGEEVATDGATIVVGASGDDAGASDGGAVYVFERIGGVWTETDVLLPADSFPNQRFGRALDVHDDVILVGVGGDDDLAQDAGATYVFQEVGGQWSQTAKLFASDAGPSTHFGDDVAVTDGRAAVLGARSLYVFEPVGGTWAETARLVPTQGGTTFDLEAIDVDADVIVSGASDGTDEVTFVHQLLGGVFWSQTQVHQPIGYAPGDLYGDAIAVDGLRMIVGAAGADVGTVLGAGTAYVYSLDGADCPTLAASPSSLSLSAGGSQVLAVQAGPEHGSRRFAVIGSASGFDPGFPLQGVRVPLLIDSYTLQTLVVGPPNPLVGSSGTLSSGGGATVLFDLPPASDPSLVGLRLHHAAILYSLAPLQIHHATNPVELQLTL